MTEPRADAQPHISCPFPGCGAALEATRTDWRCAKGHGGRNLTLVAVHAMDCAEARSLVQAGMGRPMAVGMVEDAALPHRCLPGGFAGSTVIRTEVLVAPHAYVPGMYVPKGARAPLCQDCRNPRRVHPL